MGGIFFPDTCQGTAVDVSAKDENQIGYASCPKIAILLTATIDPKNVVFVKRSDPKLREADYEGALKEWIEKTNYPIVLCENSGYASERLKTATSAASNREVEFLQFMGQDFPGELGKGYGELGIVKHAIAQSSILRDADYVVKISGRYFVSNIDVITRSLIADSSVYVMSDLRAGLVMAESVVFAFRPTFIGEYLSHYQDNINDSQGMYFEHALARACLEAMSDGLKWAPLPTRPRVIGYSGTSNVNLTRPYISWFLSDLKHRIRNRFLSN